MKRVLGRKQSMDNSRWQEALDNIEDLITRDELDTAVATVEAAIREATAGRKVAYAWSGGKDSLVLSDICRHVGITACMFAHTDLEYPAFLEWCLDHKPEGCEVINTGQNLEWLSKHQDLIFPSGKELNAWYSSVQRKAFTQFFFDKGLDMLLVGHRKQDGNIVGPGNIITKGSGEVRYAPIADWPHEMVLAYIHYHGLELPPIYGWRNGFKCGTHPWPSRMYMESKEQGYKEVYEIDPSIVAKAAELIPSAKAFIEGVRA